MAIDPTLTGVGITTHYLIPGMVINVEPGTSPSHSKITVKFTPDDEILIPVVNPLTFNLGDKVSVLIDLKAVKPQP